MNATDFFDFTNPTSLILAGLLLGSVFLFVFLNGKKKKKKKKLEKKLFSSRKPPERVKVPIKPVGDHEVNRVIHAGNGEFIPAKHPKATPAMQRREAKRRKNQRAKMSKRK